jgi:hypothetical protein
LPDDELEEFLHIEVMLRANSPFAIVGQAHRLP